jgi:hypothetical protein
LKERTSLPPKSITKYKALIAGGIGCRRIIDSEPLYYSPSKLKYHLSPVSPTHDRFQMLAQ